MIKMMLANAIYRRRKQFTLSPGVERNTPRWHTVKRSASSADICLIALRAEAHKDSARGKACASLGAINAAGAMVAFVTWLLVIAWHRRAIRPREKIRRRSVLRPNSVPEQLDDARLSTSSASATSSTMPKKITQEVRDLAKIVADWSAPAPDFTFYLFGSRVRGDHRPDSDVDLHYKLPPNPTHEATIWWTAQNSANWTALRKALPGPPCWLEQHAALRA